MAELSEPELSRMRRPDPDPTNATRNLVTEAIDSVKDLIEAKDEVVTARINAMDKAVTLIGTYPTAIDVAVNNLKSLHQEKFEGVGVRFNELNTRLTEGDRYKQTALDAALKAAQTLVDKQQENNKESIKKTEELFIKQFENINKTVEDLKTLVVVREGKSQQSATGLSTVLAIGAMLISFIGVVIVFIMNK